VLVAGPCHSYAIMEALLRSCEPLASRRDLSPVELIRVRRSRPGRRDFRGDLGCAGGDSASTRTAHPPCSTPDTEMIGGLLDDPAASETVAGWQPVLIAPDCGWFERGQKY
jgi:hypothetical protein